MGKGHLWLTNVRISYDPHPRCSSSICSKTCASSGEATYVKHLKLPSHWCLVRESRYFFLQLDPQQIFVWKGQEMPRDAKRCQEPWSNNCQQKCIDPPSGHPNIDYSDCVNIGCLMMFINPEPPNMIFRKGSKAPSTTRDFSSVYRLQASHWRTLKIEGEGWTKMEWPHNTTHKTEGFKNGQ